MGHGSDSYEVITPIVSNGVTVGGSYETIVFDLRLVYCRFVRVTAITRTKVKAADQYFSWRVT